MFLTRETTMAEVKEAPKPKTENGRGRTREIAPRASAAPMLWNDNPFAFMRRLAREMDHLFDDVGVESGWHLPRFLRRGRRLLRRGEEVATMEWSPRVEVAQREGQLVIRADLPGLTKDDIKVEVTDDAIIIEGERKAEKKEEREGSYFSECSYGSFYRAIPLPEGADASKANAEFHNGVLEVTIPAPSRPEPKCRQLEVKEAK
jgi:HSP20 family protein